MNNNLTLNALAYNLAYSDKAGSVRNNSGLGATKPRILSIAHTDAVDPKTKLRTRRSLLRHDQTVADGNGVILPTPVSVYMNVVIPVDGDATQVATAISDGIIANRQLISGTGADGSALDLAAAIFTNREQ